jgi:hypothetical protein
VQPVGYIVGYLNSTLTTARAEVSRMNTEEFIETAWSNWMKYANLPYTLLDLNFTSMPQPGLFVTNHTYVDAADVHT